MILFLVLAFTWVVALGYAFWQQYLEEHPIRFIVYDKWWNNWYGKWILKRAFKKYINSEVVILYNERPQINTQDNEQIEEHTV